MNDSPQPDGPQDDSDEEDKAFKPVRPSKWVYWSAGILTALSVTVGIIVAQNLLNDPYLASGEIDESTAYRYESSVDGYSVLFPSEPSVTSQTQQIQQYDIEFRSAQWVTDDTVYLVNAATYPEEVVADQDPDVLLQNSINGVASSTGSALSDERFTDLDGQRAIAATVNYPNGFVGYTIIAMQANTQFIVSGSGSESNWRAFVDSFVFD